MNMIDMAFGMARNARKGALGGVISPVKRLDAAGRRLIERPSDRALLPGLLCRKSLKGYSLPANLLLASEQIRADHFNHVRALTA